MRGSLAIIPKATPSPDDFGRMEAHTLLPEDLRTMSPKRALCIMKIIRIRQSSIVNSHNKEEIEERRT
jgi:hypothetical protein